MHIAKYGYPSAILRVGTGTCRVANAMVVVSMFLLAIGT